jgi:SNW domain-containing protein 1
MASLLLPKPKNLDAPTEQPMPSAPPAPAIAAPPQGRRKGWVPRTLADFGDGGAFPEIHVAQYPLDMGRKKQQSSQVLALTTDASGKARHDMVAAVGQREGKHIVSARDALKGRYLSEDELVKPADDKAAENTERTRLALAAQMADKVAGVAGSLEKATADKKGPTFIKYTPSQGVGASGASTRVIRMVEAPVDPMEPPKFKHKRVPRGPPSPPVPVMHSPPRKITQKDQQDWKIPPCISNWKNLKGYTIPLDKRLAADGRGLQEVSISDNFAKLSESLYIAERNAREEVEKRAHIQKKLAAKDKERKEDELRELAQRAREERAVAPPPAQLEELDREEVAERDELRHERKRERERERRLENKDGKRSKMTRDAERDVSERIALGQAVPNSTETLFDQRLFNQSASGMNSGFSSADDQYNIYDKALFKGGAAAETLYRPTQRKDDDWDDEDKAENQILKSARAFRSSDKGFDGSSGQPRRDGPVEFEQEDNEADPFGLDQFLSEAKESKKS